MSLTPEQQIIRKTGIGGSEISCILGLPSFGSPIEVWRAKVDPSYVRPEALRLEVGNLIEAAVVELCRRRTGYVIATPGTTYKHPEAPLVASPDGIAYEGATPRLVEAKTASKWAMADWGPDGSDAVPKQYVAQVQHNMHVLRACGFPVEEALVPVLVDLSEYRCYRIPYAKDVAEASARAGSGWWRAYVETRTAPPPDGTPSYTEYLEAKFPRPERGAEIAASSDCDRWAVQYDTAHAEKKAAEKRLRQAEQQLCMALGDGADAVVGDWWKATWRPNKNGDRRFRFESKEQ